MLNPPQLDAPLFASSLVLVVMGLLSLVFSVFLYLKSRTMRKLPRDLPVNVFHKTFNVFNPYPDQRKMIAGSVIAFLPIVVLFASLFLSFVVLAKIIEMGLLLGFFIFTICAALMMLEETFETYKNAGIFVRAIENGTELGKGDLTVFSIVQKTLPRLRTYHFCLAIMFFAFSVVLPSVVPPAVLLFAEFAGALVESTTSAGVLGPFSALFLLVVSIFMMHIIAGIVKRKIFNLPPPESLVSLNKPFEAMKEWVIWHPHELVHRSGPPEPDEMPDSEREKS